MKWTYWLGGLILCGILSLLITDAAFGTATGSVNKNGLTYMFAHSKIGALFYKSNVASGPPPFSQALSANFDGSTTFLSTSATTGLTLSYNVAQSWVFWVYVNNNGSIPYFYTVNPTSPACNMSIYDASTNFALDISCGGRADGWMTGGFTPAQWNHVVITNSGSVGSVSTAAYTMYLNGTSTGVTAHVGGNPTGTFNTATGSVYLGGGPNGNPLLGYMNMAAIYSSVLSQSDVTALYNGGNPTLDISTLASYSHILAWYRMGNFSGDTTSNIKNAANPGTFDMNSNAGVTFVTQSPH